jgi:predicted permease
MAPAALMIALNASAIFGFSLVVGELLSVKGGTVGTAILHAARALALNPIIQSAVAGVAWSLTGLALPGPVETFAKTLGGATAACALVAIGLFMATPRPRAAPMTMARVLLFKLAGQPLATWLLFLLVAPVPPVWAKTAILLAAMPTGTASFMLASFVSASALNLSARAIILSTLAAVVTVSVAILLSASLAL